MGVVRKQFARARPSAGLLLPLLLVVELVVLVGGVPVCQQHDTLNIPSCGISVQSDFGALPTNVSSLHVYFLPTHTTTLSPRVFPVRPNLRLLRVDLQHVTTDIQAGAFQHLTALTELHLLDSDPFRPLPARRLVAGTFSGMAQLLTLSVVETGVTQVDSGAFNNLPALLLLDLSRNEFDMFPTDAFLNSESLRELSLKGNKLSTLTGDVFNGWNQMKTLDLASNRISTLRATSFGQLPALESLNLASNSIRTVEDGAFARLPALMKLELGGNQLGRINANMFGALTALHDLDVNSNNLTEIADGAFRDLTGLRFLELHKNSLRQFTTRTFQGLKELVFLDIHLNEIRELGDGVFAELTELGSLYLHESNIERLSAGVFEGLKYLNLLTLQENKLTTLPEGIFDVFEQLGFISLSGNPWDCTCNITWIHEWIDSQHIAGELSTTCAADGESLLQYARDNYYICRRTTTSTAAPTTSTATAVPTTPAPTTTVTTSVPSTPSTEPGTTTTGGGGAFIVLTSSVDPVYVTTNKSGFHDVSSAGFQPNHLVIVVACLGALLVLIALIVVSVIYCRQKRFWRPPRAPATATNGSLPASPHKDDDDHRFVYSPTKNEVFFASLRDASLERGGGGITAGGDPNANRAYDNPGLHVDDFGNVKAGAQPAVLAYVSEGQPENGDVRQSYEHRLSDSGTYYIDRADADTAADDGVSGGPTAAAPQPGRDEGERPTKKERKPRKSDRKQKKSKTSGSNSGTSTRDDDDDHGGVGADNPYRDVYTVPMHPSGNSPTSSSEPVDHPELVGYMGGPEQGHDMVDDRPPSSGTGRDGGFETSNPLVEDHPVGNDRYSNGHLSSYSGYGEATRTHGEEYPMY